MPRGTSDLETDVCTVVERVVVGVEGFGGLEVGANVQRVVEPLLLQPCFALIECGHEEGVAVGGEHQFPGLEVEGDDAHVGLRNGESVYYAVRNVLLLHGFQHAWYDGGAGRVVAQQLVDGLALGQLAAHLVGAHGGQLGFGGLGVVVVGGLGVGVVGVVGGVDSVGGVGVVGGVGGHWGGQALAVAYEPQLAAQAAVDGHGGGQTVFGVLGQAGQHGFAVVPAHGGSDAAQELVARGVFGHAAYVAADDVHGLAAVGAQQGVTVVGLRGGAVDDGYEVRGDDEAVFAFLSGALGHEGLFDDFHFCTRKSIDAGPAFLRVSWRS